MAKTELHDVWIALRACGLSYRKIARRIGVSRQTQVKWAKKFGDQLQSIKKNELEFIKEQLRLARKNRLERLSGLLDKLEDDLEEQDIAQMPMASKMRIYISLLKTIRDEAEVDLSNENAIDGSLLPYLEIVSKVGTIVGKKN